MHISNSIYLDYQATTPTDPRVLSAMLPYFSESYANPHSSHAMGYIPASAIENAKANIAELIGAFPEEIFFTSGATDVKKISSGKAPISSAIFAFAFSMAEAGIYPIACEE